MEGVTHECKCTACHRTFWDDAGTTLCVGCVKAHHAALAARQARRARLIEEYVGCILTGYASRPGVPSKDPESTSFVTRVATEYAEAVIAAT